MVITSTLRRTGVVDFEVRSPGNGYQNGEEVQISGTGDGFTGNLTVNQDGNITGVQITDPGTGYSNNEQVSIIGSTGNSGLITAVLGGSLYLDANLTIPGGEVLYARTLVHASTRNSLTEDEKWLDRYFDSIRERSRTWWRVIWLTITSRILKRKCMGRIPLGMIRTEPTNGRFGNHIPDQSAST